MHIKKSGSRKFYRMRFTLTFKIVLFIILFFSFCSPKNETSFFLNIERENYWSNQSYRITIFDDGRVFLSTGVFFEKKGKRAFQIKKDIQKKIQNSVVEYVKARKAELTDSFRFCYDCAKIKLEYYDGFEKEYYFSDEASKEDFIKLEKELEQWENLLGISENDKRCEECK